MKTFNPKLFTTLKHYDKTSLLNDLISGIIVAIIALPLSIALALASGANPQQGLYTAVIAGFITALLGGSKVNITGPTAAFAGILYGILTNENLGYDVLFYATVMAGIILVLLGIFKLGSFIKFMPYPITVGFTAGIAITLIVGQLKDFTLISYVPLDFKLEYTHQKLHAFFISLENFSIESLFVGLISLAILILWGLWNKKKDNKICAFLGKIPASLIAVIVGSLLVAVIPTLRDNVNTIGSLYTIKSGFPAFNIPTFSGNKIVSAIPLAFEIALLAAIESLLSCVVSDEMIKDVHNPNTELIALGIGNVGSVLFGGIPATGAIARTAANVNNGGRSPVAGMVHALLLLLVLLFLMPYAGIIPMPVIASILIMVAYNMCGLKKIVSICKTKNTGDIVVLFATMIVTVIKDLIFGIGIGIILTLIFYFIGKNKSKK